MTVPILPQEIGDCPYFALQEIGDCPYFALGDCPYFALGDCPYFAPILPCLIQARAEAARARVEGLAEEIQRQQERADALRGHLESERSEHEKVAAQATELTQEVGTLQATVKLRTWAMVVALAGFLVTVGAMLRAR